MANEDHRTTYDVMQAKAGTHRFDPRQSVVLSWPNGSVAAAHAWLENNDAEPGDRLFIIPHDDKIARAFLFVVGEVLPEPPRVPPVRPSVGSA